jgi:hypothetical protein
MFALTRSRPLRFMTACILAGAFAACTPAPTEETPSPGTGGSSSSGTGGSPSSKGGSGGSSEGSGGSGGAPSGTGGSTTGTGGTSTSTGGTTGTGGSSEGTGGSAPGTGGTTATDAGGSDTPSTTPPSGGPYKVMLLLGDPHPDDGSKIGMTEILTGMKATHNVVLETMPSSQAKAAMLMDKALIIAGPNTTFCGDNPDPGLKTLPVPIMVSKDCNTSAIGLGSMMNTANSFNSINIVKSDHPLAAGLSGTVRVFTDNVCRLVRGGGLGEGAIKIANPPTDTGTWSIFAYEKGGMMPGGLAAPAKRIGFFWHRPSNVTADGKKLFIAAVAWAIAP